MKLDSLPDDVLYEIIANLQVIDVIRLRQVSTNLKRVTSDRTVWNSAYRHSTLLRPSGPLPTLPTRALESHLLCASRLHETWTSPSPQPKSRRQLSGACRTPFCMELVEGRWLLIGDNDSLRCYDLDADVAETTCTKPVALHVSTVAQMACRVCTDDAGHQFVRIAIAREVGAQEIILMTLSLESPHQFGETGRVRIPIDAGRHMSLRGNFLVVATRQSTLLFDVHSLQPYKVPPPRSQNGERIAAANFYGPVLTDTHLITAYLYPQKTHFEVFSLPQPGVLKSPNVPLPTLIPTHTGSHTLLFFEQPFISPPPSSEPSSSSSSSSAPSDVCFRFLANAISAPNESSKIHIIELRLPPPGAAADSPTPLLINILSSTEFNGHPYRTYVSTSMGALRAIGLGYLHNSHHSQDSGLRCVGYEVRAPFDDERVAPVELRELSLGLVGGHDDRTGVSHRNLAWDGIRGRLCVELPPSRMPIIQVLDFV